MTALTEIRTKVRRLTGRPSPQQITDTQIDDYVNTFYLYDMPDTLRLVTQETTFEFMTEANVDVYNLETMQFWTGESNQSIVNVFVNLKPPAYIAGYQSFWSQDREQFFSIYPKLAEITFTTVGDGTPGPYTFTFASTPVLQFSVTVGTIDDTGATINVIDVPTNRTTGTWQEINTNTAVTGSITFLTGASTITFANNIPSGNEITFTAVPYQANRPQALLLYDNEITLRPVPDKNYLVCMNAYKRPTALLAADDPTLKQWWQFLAYGAAKKVFEDSQDMDGVTAIMPELKNQERLVLRRTIVERTQQRTATIYTEQTSQSTSNFQNRF